MHFALLQSTFVFANTIVFSSSSVQPFLRQQFCAVTTNVSANKKCSAITAVFGQEKYMAQAKQLLYSSREMWSQLSRTQFPEGNQFSALSAIIGIMIGFSRPLVVNAELLANMRWRVCFTTAPQTQWAFQGIFCDVHPEIQ